MNVILSKEAKLDINSIFMYIAEDSIRYAIETDRNIRLAIHNLEIFPYMGRYVPEIFNKRYREIIYKSYRIVYEVFEETNTVYIHFILHGKRDFKSYYNSYLRNKFF